MPTIKAMLDQLDAASLHLRELNSGDVENNAPEILNKRTGYLRLLDELNRTITAHPDFAPDSDNAEEWTRRFREARHAIAAHQVSWGMAKMKADPAGYRSTSRQLGQSNFAMFDWLRAKA